MNSALLGFCCGGVKKLMRLHGLASPQAVLQRVIDYLRVVTDCQLRSYAQAVQTVNLRQRGGLPDPALIQATAWLGKTHTPGHESPTWSDVFEQLPDLKAWQSGFAYMPQAQLATCADVHWAFVLDLDAMALHVFDNRNARYPWEAIGSAEPPICQIALSRARDLTPSDLRVLQGLLQQNVACDGERVTLPAKDFTSADSAWSDGWVACVQVQDGQPSLLMQRAGIAVRFNRIGALRLSQGGVRHQLGPCIHPPILAMAEAIYGENASLSQISQLAAASQCVPFAASEPALPLLDLGLRKSNGLDLVLGPAYFDQLRALMIHNGMTVQGWRFLIRQQQPVLRFVLGFLPPSVRVIGAFASLVNLMASALQNTPLLFARCQASLSGVERILDRTRGRPDPVRQENARIFLRALVRASLDDVQMRNLDHDAQDVSDFVYNCPGVLKGATWRSLCRRSDDWHRALLIAVDPATDVRWPALLPRFVTGPFEALELDCGQLLAQEGLEQRHCIGTYVNACSTGASRVFSLRRGGKRVATLELQRTHDASWRLVQIRGKANSPVTDQSTLDAAESVAHAYSRSAQQVQAHGGRAAHPALQPGAYMTPSYVVHRQDHWTG